MVEVPFRVRALFRVSEPEFRKRVVPLFRVTAPVPKGVVGEPALNISKVPAVTIVPPE